MTPLATVRSWNSCGIEPARTGLAPTICVPRALNRAGLSESDVDLVEINEAFATMAVACARKLGFPHDIVNVNGGAVGHRAPGGRLGRAHFGDADPRATPTRRRHRGRHPVRRRRHGLGDGARGARTRLGGGGGRRRPRLHARSVSGAGSGHTPLPAAGRPRERQREPSTAGGVRPAGADRGRSPRSTGAAWSGGTRPAGGEPDHRVRSFSRSSQERTEFGEGG